MTYRQVLTLDPNHPAATDTYRLHQLVLAGFPDLPEVSGDARARLGVLHLAAAKPPKPAQVHTPGVPYQGLVTRVLVQSPQPGTWEHVAGIHHAANPIQVDTHLDAGQTIEIRARLNPVTRHHGTPTPVTGAGNIAAWAARMLTGHGMDLDTSSTTVSHPLRLTGIRNGQRLTVSTVTLQGLVTVTDPAAATNALTSGVGRSKGWGCGLVRHRHLTPVA